MVRLPVAALTVTTLMSVSAGLPAYAQPAAGVAVSTWEDVASWNTVHPIETDDIVYANVSLVRNPSASPDPGTPSGIRAPGVF